MKKTIKNTSASYVSKIWLIVLPIIIILFVILIWVIASKNADSKRFSTVESKKNLVVQKMINLFPNKLGATSEKNACFNTEQGPYNNGRLWCQTATIISLKSDISFESVGDSFITAAKSSQQKGYKSSSNSVLRYWFETNEGITCELSGTDSMGKMFGSATLRLDNDAQKPYVAVACADRAKAKHYQYID